ncbi:MAG: metallophosphoesterase [Undibacterium sp.]|uniref:metallophosphoesterase family protein n=1 Tax=Undibacterium sp. TaxID=1914977 RepID=UPI00271A695D|nr:metallophosphoesterase [Undibacterium sp.]MDO8652013.1 metallophosphoesterase [Undibacterium sp.]
MPHFASFFASLVLASIPLVTPELAHARKTLSGKPIAKSLTVYAAGDIADCKKAPPAESMAAKTAALITAGLAQDNKALVLTLGDNTYPVGRPEEFINCYDTTWGKFKTKTLPSPGNHDYGMPLALGYYNYFDELAGPDRRGYYSKTAGNWLILSLNSNLGEIPMQEQLSWLKEQLKDNKRLCTLAYWHHPVFSSGGHRSNEVMQEAWKMLVTAKADIVLASHDHDYERFVPLNAEGERDDKNGIRSFVVGTGGASLTPMFFAKSTTEIRDNATHGVLKLNLHAKSYDWEFLPVEGQIFTDKGQGNCH